MINIFKKKTKTIDKSKTIKLFDFIESFNMYKEIYNSTMEELAILIVYNNQSKFNEYSYKLTSNFTYEINFEAEERYGRTTENIDDIVISNLIELYGSDELKKGISFLNELGYYYYENLFNNLEILYDNKYKTKIFYDKLENDVWGKGENWLDYYIIGSLQDTLNLINILKNLNKNQDILLFDATSYDKLIEALYNYKKLDSYKNIFSKDNRLLDIYKGKELDDELLQSINFDNKNISGINISKNKNININFDKIVHDLTDANISGYKLDEYTFRNYNLTNCNMTNTGAIIDLASCIITTESKVNSGTIFDEKNKFIFGNTELDDETVKKLNLTIKKS